MNHILRALVFVAGLALALPLALPGWAAENIQGQRSAVVESSHIFCDATGTSPVHKAPCFLRSLYVTSTTVAGFLMTFNAVSAPADGAVLPWECIAVPAGSSQSIDFGDTMEAYSVGLTAVFSTTGCFTKTSSSTAFFRAAVQ